MGNCTHPDGFIAIVSDLMPHSRSSASGGLKLLPVAGLFADGWMSNIHRRHSLPVEESHSLVSTGGNPKHSNDSLQCPTRFPVCSTFFGSVLLGFLLCARTAFQNGLAGKILSISYWAFPPIEGCITLLKHSFFRFLEDDDDDDDDADADAGGDDDEDDDDDDDDDADAGGDDDDDDEEPMI